MFFRAAVRTPVVNLVTTLDVNHEPRKPIVWAIIRVRIKYEHWAFVFGVWYLQISVRLLVLQTCY